MSPEGMIICFVVLAIIVVWFISGLMAAYRDKKRFREKLASLKGEKPNKKYEDGELHNLAQTSLHSFQVDDITWNDLAMDDLFKRLDYTYSQPGEQALYELLRNPVLSEEILAHREEIISYYMEHDDERIEMQLHFATIGRNGKYSLPQYITYLSDAVASSNSKDICMLLLIIGAAISMIWFPDYGAIVLAASLLYNFVSYLKEKGKQNPYIATFSFILRFLKQMDGLLVRCPDILQNERDEMKEKRDAFAGFERGSWIVTGTSTLSDDPLKILLDYLCMFFHFDLMKCRQMHRDLQAKKEQLLALFEQAGLIEAMISISLYRTSLGYYCTPVLTADKQLKLQTKSLVHPLVEGAVGNDFAEESSVILTGSNASGKSTFLKAVAIASIMAQSVHTVCAASYESSFVNVYSSMSLTDNLLMGDSYFIVEIKAVKRIFDAANEDTPIRAFIDEVLRGTNTAERIAASVELLRELFTKDVQTFAATHDIELAKAMQGQYQNYHFDEQITDGDVHFSYKIKEGYATSRNAIALLGVLGFDEGLVSRAKERVLEFDAIERKE